MGTYRPQTVNRRYLCIIQLMFIIETGCVPLEETTTQKTLFNPSKSSNYTGYVPPALTFRSFVLCSENVSMVLCASRNKHLLFLPPQNIMGCSV